MKKTFILFILSFLLGHSILWAQGIVGQKKSVSITDLINENKEYADKDIDETLVEMERKKQEEFDKKWGTESIPFQFVEMMPEYRGGEGVMLRFIADSLRYPQPSEDKNIYGEVLVKVIIEKDGTLNRSEIERSLHPDYDAEAIRVVESMPRWIPGRQGGRPVRVYAIIPVCFRAR